MGRASRIWVSASLSAVLAAGSASAVAPLHGQSSSSTSEANAFALYFAVSSGGGYSVFGANGVPVPCGNGGLAFECRVESISFAEMDITAASAATILANVGKDPSNAQVIFAGQVSSGTLNVYQTWISPTPVATWSELFGVSHSNEQALVINEWTPASLGTLDFTYAPLAPTCFGAPCAGSLEDVEKDVTTTAGAIIAGRWERGGAFEVRNYFLAVVIGVTTGDGSYTFCAADQGICDNACGPPGGGCLTLHGRGPWLNPAMVHAPSFQQWQLATGQLLPSDVSAAADAGTP